MLINLEEGQRCSEINRSLNLDSCGTALRADSFLAVDVPLPWPKPVFDHQFLSGVAEFLEGYSKPVRLLASVPEDNERLTITRYELKGNGFSGKSFFDRKQVIFQPSNLLVALKKILDGESSGELREDLGEEQLKEIWICTQGSHDICCGSEGTSLALEANMKLQDVKVRRVSHLGGHRFAPTAVTFPNGRMWSYLNIENLYEIFNQTSFDEALLKKCRGWSGLEIGPEQVAEREGLSRFGWDWDKYQRKTVDKRMIYHY